jgi:hypothetical protein
MNEELISLLLEVTDVHEGKVVIVNANITDKITHLSISCLVEISQDTILELRVSSYRLVVSYFLVNGILKSWLVSEDILELALINWLSLLLSEVKLGLLESVSILCVEVFFF